MSKNIYELSDQLFQLRRDFLPHEIGGVFLSAERVRQLTDGLMNLGQAALKEAHEISRHRWNLQAQAERDLDGERIAELASQPGTNVRLFPIVPRPFSDGRPKGGAA
ncbi:hypothetical protein [Mesorhizobium sp. 2RAF21]|uniref:hypothetical protein n=1 Tax=Mesorhizobium sp. 2RAF21 TaxID=3232995 RepID=UPI003F9C4F3C